MIEGLPKDAIYAASPVTSAQLSAAETDTNTANGDVNAACANYLALSQQKADKYGALQGLMKQVINFATGIAGITQKQLKLLGWDTKADPKALQAPGQCLLSELISIERSPKTAANPRFTNRWCARRARRRGCIESPH